MKLIPTILCGGAGSRLWPVSRELHPKPFIRLVDGQSLLQKAWLRGAVLPNVDETLTVTNREIIFKTKDEYKEVVADIASKDIFNSFILEPFGRNTAPAIAAAALQVAARHGDDACLLVLAADHLIVNQTAFNQAVAKAMQLAMQGKLVTFGIKPDSPETGYGYIEADGNNVKRFVEKPSFEKAQEYFVSGHYLWNSGMFCFTAGSILSEMHQYCPVILESTIKCMAQSLSSEGRGFSQIELDSASFKLVPNESIDYAVMEKSSNVAVVPCSIGWSDIGTWQALGDLIEADANGNRAQGEVLLHDTLNCTIQSEGRLIATAGVKNLIIIDTPDAILVADKSSAQDVKNIYTELQSKNHDSYKIHRTVHRPWGSYTVLQVSEGFKIKRIDVNPGAKLSLQMHHHRSEHWVVVSGTATISNNGIEYNLEANQSTYVPQTHLHRLINNGTDLLSIIEVQCGDYVGEDDIVRFDDTYGRQ